MVPLYKPYMPELPQLNRILNSGQLAYGDYSMEFECRISDYIGVDNVLATSSFNMAISVAISTLDICPGDTIIASPMACLASTQPFAAYGVRVRWADVDPRTGTLDPESVRKKIDGEIKAIMHNHFCGYPGYIDEINEIGREYGIPVIDDGIEAFGSIYKGNKIGSCGTDVTVFSFQAVRIPNTIDGGSVIFYNRDLYDKAVLVRDCGIDRKIFRDDLGEISPECDITLRGHSATISNVNSYIGICQMDHMEALIEKQRSVAERWKNKLADNRNIKLLGRKEIVPNYWVLGTRVDNKVEQIREYREKGWYASGVHINNNIYSVFGESEPLPGVEDFKNHFMALPCGWWVDENMVDCNG